MGLEKEISPGVQVSMNEVDYDFVNEIKRLTKDSSKYLKLLVEDINKEFEEIGLDAKILYNTLLLGEDLYDLNLVFEFEHCISIISRACHHQNPSSTVKNLLGAMDSLARKMSQARDASGGTSWRSGSTNNISIMSFAKTFKRSLMEIKNNSASIGLSSTSANSIYTSYHIPGDARGLEDILSSKSERARLAQEFVNIVNKQITAISIAEVYGDMVFQTLSSVIHPKDDGGEDA